MIRREFEELMLKEFHETLSPSEKTRLDEWMNSQSDECDDMMQRGGIFEFESLQLVDPPFDLKANVLSEVARLPRPKRVQKASELSMSSFLKSWFQPQPALTFGLGVVTGAIILVMATLLISPYDSVPSPQATATIGHQQIVPQAADFKAYSFGLDRTSGEIRAGKTEGEFLIEVEISAESEAVVEFEIDPNRLSFKGLYQQSGGPLEFSTLSERLRVVHNGEYRYRLLFEPGKAQIGPIAVSVESAGQNWRGIISFESSDND